jgi:hypothetical protein
MRCYFSSEKSGPPEEPGSGFVSFVIPELKITFRARYHGTAAACEYASLLALLEFVDINPAVFEGKALELFGDSFDVVNQLNHRLACRKELENFRNAALMLRDHIPYTIDWIPPAQNPAGPQSLSI